MNDSYIQHARTLLRTSEVGVLATHSKRHPGYPFGSVSTFMSTHEGDIIFYISDLAQHTKNIHNNKKMSFTVFSEANNTTLLDSDPNAGARLCVMGEAALIASDSTVRKRYFTLFPESEKYEKMHDFAFYQLKAQQIRYIGGFGDIHWISEDAWLQNTPEWADNENYVIQHMNDDHADAVQLIYQHHTEKMANNAMLLAANPDGFFIKNTGEKPLYIEFDSPVYSSEQIRNAFIELTKNARKKLTS